MKSNIAAHAFATEKIQALLTNVRDVRVQKSRSFCGSILFFFVVDRRPACIFANIGILTMRSSQVADELGQTLRTDEIVEWALEADETGEA
jgi:hypothetical protein